MKRLPIAAAKEVSKKYNQDQVILVTLDRADNLMHVATFGKTLKDCDEAARGGNFVKKALGYPDDKCHDVPARVQKNLHKVEAENEIMRVVLENLKKRLLFIRYPGMPAPQLTVNKEMVESIDAALLGWQYCDGTHRSVAEHYKRVRKYIEGSTDGD